MSRPAGMETAPADDARDLRPDRLTNTMTTVLGIDAAWTAGQPSGVALVQRVGSRWRCRAVAPGYAAFDQLARGLDWDWRTQVPGGQADVEQLLGAAALITGGPPDLVAVDMPVATVEITGRRAADDAVSKRFARQHCATHSPNAQRPGELGAQLTQRFHAAGFEVATCSTAPGTPGKLLEVYPHPALLALLRVGMRVRYKVSKSPTFWPGKTAPERIELLLAEFHAILNGLAAHIDGISLQLPRAQDVKSLTSLKRYEDAIDALVCCWVGCQYLDGQAVAFGDDTSAIWCPIG